MSNQRHLNRQRQRRTWRVSNHVKRNSTRPRLAVFRSLQHMYAQIIDDNAGRTLAAASSTEKAVRTQLRYGGNKDAAALVGKTLAERALEAGVTQVAFDRRECRYHGRIAALAEAARAAGLQF